MSMNLDIEKTKEFYRGFTPCRCIDCQNYYVQIEEKYPELCRYLNSFGIDALRPWELGAVESTEKGTVDYVMCQYLAIGSCEEDFKQTVEGIEITKAATYPEPQNLKGDHFALEFSLSLPRVLEVKKLDKKRIKLSFKELKRRFGFRKGKHYYPLKNVKTDKERFYISKEIAVRHEQKIAQYLLGKFTVYKSGEEFFHIPWGEVADKYNFRLVYCGLELVYFDSDYNWLIYVSKNTVTFVGSIVPDIKNLLHE